MTIPKDSEILRTNSPVVDCYLVDSSCLYTRAAS